MSAVISVYSSSSSRSASISLLPGERVLEPGDQPGAGLLDAALEPLEQGRLLLDGAE